MEVPETQLIDSVMDPTAQFSYQEQGRCLRLRSSSAWRYLSANCGDDSKVKHSWERHGVSLDSIGGRGECGFLLVGLLTQCSAGADAGFLV